MIASLIVFVIQMGLQAPLARPDGPEQQDPPAKLSDLSIDDLLQLDVTSVSRKEQHLMDAPAAVYVIRGEDIRRAGVTTIAEALRMAPGVQVARINSNTWGISARGFNFRWANKLQVLIDGQSVYEPGFGGVSWDILDTNLEDIDRIEVIRGPGGTLWGANAVNGVVNIMTGQHALCRQDDIMQTPRVADGCELPGALRGQTVGAGSRQFCSVPFQSSRKRSATEQSNEAHGCGKQLAHLGKGGNHV